MDSNQREWNFYSCEFVLIRGFQRFQQSNGVFLPKKFGTALEKAAIMPN